MGDNINRVTPVERTNRAGFNEFRNRYKDKQKQTNSNKDNKNKRGNDTFESILRKSFQEKQGSRTDDDGSR